MATHGAQWTPPPNWPAAPEGFKPTDGWSPDEEWGPAPDGWNFWPVSSEEPAARSVHSHAKTAGETQPMSLPGIESYPGFVTAKQAKRSKLTSRPVVGIAAGIAGLLLGMSATQGAAGEAEDKAKTQIAQIRTDAAEEVAQVEDEAQQVQEEAVEAAVDEAVEETVAKERARADKLVIEAEDKAEDAIAESKPQPLVSSTDPRFDTCGEANANGYGNYRKGVDTEYGWYQDRDGDGVVCE